jgi:hypothetical protein
MTDYQRSERERREANLFRNRITIYKSFQRIADDIGRLLCTTDTSPIFLFTDLRQEYPRALLSLPCLREKIEKQELICTRISSKLPRNGSNPLFPVNYMDRQIRKNSANHVRETVQYSRNTNNCLEHLALFQLEHNYQKTFRVKEETKQDNRLHAEVAGIPSSTIAMELATLYSLRRFVTRIKLTFSQALVWFRMVGTIDRWDGGYAPHYVWM